LCIGGTAAALEWIDAAVKRLRENYDIENI
jgi:hypothetical protein